MIYHDGNLVYSKIATVLLICITCVGTRNKKHLEFMLPDGAWDNSWGTRSFKWTYWGVKSSNRGIKKAEPYVAASPGGR